MKSIFIVIIAMCLQFNGTSISEDRSSLNAFERHEPAIPQNGSLQGVCLWNEDGEINESQIHLDEL